MTAPLRIFLWFVSEQRSWFDPFYFPAGICLGFMFPSAPKSLPVKSQAALLEPRGSSHLPPRQAARLQRDTKFSLKAHRLRLAPFPPSFDFFPRRKVRPSTRMQISWAKWRKSRFILKDAELVPVSSNLRKSQREGKERATEGPPGSKSHMTPVYVTWKGCLAFPGHGDLRAPE